MSEPPIVKPGSAEASGTAEKKAESGPPGMPVLVESKGFSATALVKQAMSILYEIDTVPATGDEIAAVASALKMTAVPGLDRPLLKSRAAGIPGLALALRPLVAPNYSGTDGETILAARVDGKTELDSGYGAVANFPGLINPVETAKRGEVSFTLNVRVYQPKYQNLYGNRPVPGLGAWTEVLAHELCLHAEPYLDSILSYRAGAFWPGQLSRAQHWLFLRRGVPRYFLWLNRLRLGEHRGLAPEMAASAKSWASDEPDNPPPSIANVLASNAVLENLRELASAFHLPQQPDEQTKAAMQDTLAELVRPFMQQQKLWWWPS